MEAAENGRTTALVLGASTSKMTVDHLKQKVLELKKESVSSKKIGSRIAVKLAAERNISALILESPYFSLERSMDLRCESSNVSVSWTSR